jgi:hypothetical protein
MQAFRSMVVLGAVLLVAGCGDDTATGGAGGGEPSGSGTIAVQISGEDFGTDGFLFPTGSEATIADGWELSFDHVLVTIGSVSVADNPDKDPSDQSVTGAVVAEAVGPWAIDLAKQGSVPGASGEGTATPLAKIDKQNKNGDVPFAADRRYAFSFETVGAAAAATKVNFDGDAAAEAAYQLAVAGGCSVLYQGTATFKGTACETGDEAYDFTAIPQSISFTLCYDTPTKYLNCQNEENQGDPFADEEFQRGIPIFSNNESLAQITLHLDHPLYSDVEHEPAIYFDQFASAMVGQPAGVELTLDLLDGVDPTGFTDAAGVPLPWRTCDGSPLPAGAQRAFETGSIPVGPGEAAATGFRDYVDYTKYVQSSQGHLNGGEGLCYAARQYPSPP